MSIFPARLLAIFTVLMPLSVFSMSFKESVLFVEGKTYSKNQRWTRVSTNTENQIELLLKVLSSSKSGKLLIDKANKLIKKTNSKKSLYDFIKKGEVSLTDTTLVRHFTVERPDHITYESKSKIFLNEDLSIEDAVLDLAHELTHFVDRPTNNPYSSGFDLEFYIESTILGDGGEAQAFITECDIMREIFPKRYNQNKSCMELAATLPESLSRRALARRLFFRLGEFYEEFHENIRGFDMKPGSFPQLTRKEPLFISAAYELPYPLAAIYEFKEIMSSVCRNDQKRIALLQEKETSRSPASEQIESTVNEHFSKCQRYL